jgi:hypothetical protein
MGRTKPTIGAIVWLCVAVISMLAAQLSERPAAAAGGSIYPLAETLAPIFDFQIEKGQLVLNRAAWEKTADQGRKQAIDSMNANLQRQQKVTLEDILRMKEEGKNQGVVQQALMQMQRQDQVKAYAKQMANLPDLYFLCNTVWQKAYSSGGMNGNNPRGNMIRPGDGTFSQSFQGSELSFQASGTTESERIQICETRSPNALYFSNDDIDGFRLEWTTADNDLIVLQQHPDSFAVLTIRNEKIFSDSAETFVAFVQTHRELMTDFIFPELARVGIRLALPPSNPAVRAAALNFLENSAEGSVDIEQLLNEVASADRKTRERAQNLIAANYEQFETAIEERLQSKVLSIGARSPLVKIVESQNKSRTPRQTVVAFGLLEDPQYLVSLLEDADPRAFVEIIHRLEKLTGQKLGTDPEKWKAWAKNKPDERK